MDKLKVDNILLALASAYVWVASADDSVEEIEFKRFEHCILESPFATQFNNADVRRYFKDMVEAFRADFEKALSLTSTRIRELKNEPQFCQEIKRFTRAALVGDGKLKQAEEMALIEIGNIIGLKI